VYVAILHNRLAADASAADRDVLVQAESVEAALRQLGHASAAIACDLDLQSLQDQLRQRPPDVVFNLVESLDGSDSLGFLVPALLDRMGVPYSGSPTVATFLTNHKLLAKQRLVQAGLPTPIWLADAPEAWTPPGTASAGNRFQPGHRFIIKAISEHASVGLDEHSLVTVNGETELQDRLREFRQTLQRPCFAEQFVEGREFNISLLADAAGCEVLPPAEIDFSAFPAGKPRLVGYRAKWDEDTFEFQNTPRRFDFPPEDDRLLSQLAQLSAACWQLFGVRGYTRVDYRVDAAGQPWILEVNTNPCLSPDAGFAAALQRAGIDFAAAVARILADALAR